ncbi:MAG: hypothetical protein M1828_004600 [Chrysothrix sp. TS-e1954]|nr:MAG: hypothetical protein M1828_004600 [Chrysothrix sp. TS-e1954]
MSAQGNVRGGRASRSRAQPQTLATRLAQIEGYLERQSSDQSSPPQQAFDIGTLNEDDMDKLDDLYFQGMHGQLGFIHQARYRAAAHPRTQSKVPKHLQYAMWALVSIVTQNNYSHAASGLYQAARQELERVEMQDEVRSNLNVSQLQAWVLIAAFEMARMHLHRAWMSIGRAIRLALLLRLHMLDLDDHDPVFDASERVCPPRDWTEKEEWKAAFWGAYMADRYSSLGFGLPPSLDERDICTALPASEEAFQSSTEVPSVTLARAIAGESPELLSYRAAGMVVLTLGTRRLSALKRWSAEQHSQSGPNEGVWEQGSWIETMLTTKFSPLPHLSIDLSPTAQNDSRAVFYHVLTQCMTICVLQTASLAASQTQISNESHQHCIKLQLEAAERIVAIMQAEVDGKQANISNSFLFFCLYATASVFAKSLARAPDVSTEQSLKYVLINLVKQRGRYRLNNTFLDDLQSEHPDLEAALNILKLGDDSHEAEAQNDPELATNQGGQQLVSEETPMEFGSHEMRSDPATEFKAQQMFQPRGSGYGTDPNGAALFDPSWSLLNWDTFPDFMETFSGDPYGVSGGYWNVNTNDISMDMLNENDIAPTFT